MTTQNDGLDMDYKIIIRFCKYIENTSHQSSNSHRNWPLLVQISGEKKNDKVSITVNYVLIAFS